MHGLNSTSGIVALIAAATALAALISTVWLARSLRLARAQQRLVLGERGERDLVEHAEQLEHGFRALRDYVEDVAMQLDRRLGVSEDRLDRAFTHRALVRYDAYHELSGRQSLSIALLDDAQSGIVVSSIHHRDQARLYAKQVHEGRGELELSPEEQQAVRLALGGDGAPSD